MAAKTRTDKAGAPKPVLMETGDLPPLEFTPGELTEAVACWDLVLPDDAWPIYERMLQVPEFGVRVAVALQNACKLTADGKMSPDRTLDAAILPAFTVGLILGLNRNPPVPAPKGMGKEAEDGRLEAAKTLVEVVDRQLTAWAELYPDRKDDSAGHREVEAALQACREAGL